MDAILIILFCTFKSWQSKLRIWSNRILPSHWRLSYPKIHIYIKIYIRQRVCNNHLSICSTVEYSLVRFSLLICFQSIWKYRKYRIRIHWWIYIYIDIWLFLNDCFAIDRLLDGRLIEKDELFIMDYYSILFFNSIPPYVEYSLDFEKNMFKWNMERCKGSTFIPLLSTYFSNY